jgi:threonine dehydrogenase-like Zn-dependent dehydrogenase
MRAVTWHGRRDVRVEEVPDPTIREPTDAIVRITTTGLCGSDLHLYEVMGPFLGEGDILGHEPMGIVEEVGAEVTAVRPGDRVVVPFNISCGTCFMCGQGLHSQCETTQVREQGMGAALFGYTKLYGKVPGGQAEYLRVPFGNTLPIKVPEGPPDDRFVYLSDVLPTAWQASSTRRSPTAARWSCSAWARSATCPRGSPCCAAPGSSASTSSTSGSNGRAATAWRRSTCASTTTSPR